jgi:hypothetical protein
MSPKLTSGLLATAMLGIGVLGSGTATAAPVVYSFTSGTSAAQAIFDIVAGNLQVTLTNTSTADVTAPAQLLTAVYWSGTADLAVGSAILNAGSTVFYDVEGQPAGGVVGGEWAGGLIKNSVVFTLLDSTLLTPLSLASITNVWFQDGTSLDEPQFHGSCTSGCPGDNTPEVPLPAALPLLLGGLGGLVWISRRQKRRGSSAA